MSKRPSGPRIPAGNDWPAARIAITKYYARVGPPAVREKLKALLAREERRRQRSGRDA